MSGSKAEVYRNRKSIIDRWFRLSTLAVDYIVVLITSVHSLHFSRNCQAVIHVLIKVLAMLWEASFLVGVSSRVVEIGGWSCCTVGDVMNRASDCRVEGRRIEFRAGQQFPLSTWQQSVPNSLGNADDRKRLGFCFLYVLFSVSFLTFSWPIKHRAFPDVQN